MDWLYGREPTPREMSRRAQTQIGSSLRQLGQQREMTEEQEREARAQAKIYARKGDLGMVKVRELSLSLFPTV